MSEIIQVPTWGPGVMTQKGLGLLSKLIKGNTLKITRAEIGAGWVDPDLLIQQTAVMEPMQELSFWTLSYPEEGKCVVTCRLTNEGNTANYVGRNIGIYAEDPDEGEILYYITQVKEATGGTGIPSADIIPGYSATWELTIFYGMADGVNVTVDPAGAVTLEDMQAYVAEYVREVLGAGFGAITDEEIDSVFPGTGGSVGGGGSAGGGEVGSIEVSAIKNSEIDSIVDSIL